MGALPTGRRRGDPVPGSLRGLDVTARRPPSSIADRSFTGLLTIALTQNRTSPGLVHRQPCDISKSYDASSAAFSGSISRSSMHGKRSVMDSAVSSTSSNSACDT